MSGIAPAPLPARDWNTRGTAGMGANAAAKATKASRAVRERVRTYASASVARFAGDGEKARARCPGALLVTVEGKVLTAGAPPGPGYIARATFGRLSDGT